MNEQIDSDSYETFLNELMLGSVMEDDLAEVIALQFGGIIPPVKQTAEPGPGDPGKSGVVKRSGFIRSSELIIDEHPESASSSTSHTSTSGSDFPTFEDNGIGILPIGEGSVVDEPVPALDAMSTVIGRKRDVPDTYGDFGMFVDHSQLLTDEAVEIGFVKPSATVSTPQTTTQPSRKIFTASGTVLKSPFPPSPDAATLQVGQLFHQYYPNSPAPPDTVKYFVDCVRDGRMSITEVENQIRMAIQQYNQQRVPSPASIRRAVLREPSPPRRATGSKYAHIPAPQLSIPSTKHPSIEESSERSPLAKELALAFLEQCQLKYCGDVPLPAALKQGLLISLVKGELSRSEVAVQIRRSKEGLKHTQQLMEERRMIASYLNSAAKLLCPSNLPTSLEVAELARLVQDGTKKWEQALEEFDKRNNR